MIQPSSNESKVSQQRLGIQLLIFDTDIPYWLTKSRWGPKTSTLPLRASGSIASLLAAPIYIYRCWWNLLHITKRFTIINCKCTIAYFSLSKNADFYYWVIDCVSILCIFNEYLDFFQNELKLKVDIYPVTQFTDFTFIASSLPTPRTEQKEVQIRHGRSGVFGWGNVFFQTLIDMFIKHRLEKAWSLNCTPS